MTIQNAGDACASVWIYYTQERSCEHQAEQQIEFIAPGEAIRVGPDGDVDFPAQITVGWVGSAHITSPEPFVGHRRRSMGRRLYYACDLRWCIC